MLASLPSWECGLKFRHGVLLWQSFMVTPFVGVWIEILSPHRLGILHNRHSLRGSVDWNKLPVKPCALNIWSLPSWECGLKLLFSPFLLVFRTRHSLRGSVDWNLSSYNLVPPLVGHSLRGSVDWNPHGTVIPSIALCHSLRGSVDWNLCCCILSHCSYESLPSWECGLKSRKT